MEFLELLQTGRPVLLDGGMGTMLQAKGLPVGATPELTALEHPEWLLDIHRAYVEAGAQILYANTFGANREKLSHCGKTVEEIVPAAVALAKEAAQGRALVALDIGPTGQLLEPTGILDFETAVDIFAQVVRAGAAAGADLIVIETMTDLQEARAALLAAKENSGLPVLVTMTYEATGRTFLGCSPAAAALTLEGMGADAIGVNCSLGPREMPPLVEELLQWTTLPIVLKPNAGLPHPDGSGYDITPQEFAHSLAQLTDLGVQVFGGCCGTTPEYIALLRQALEGRSVRQIPRHVPAAVCSGMQVVPIDRVRVIGERINPTGKKRMKEALKAGDVDYMLGQALEQTEAGADILDVNVGLPEIDEAEMMVRTVKALQGVTEAPLQLDSTDPKVLEGALRVYCGKAIVNSVNGEEAVLDAILPLVKKYGAAVVGLTLDEGGIPKTVQARMDIAKRILDRALSFGHAERGRVHRLPHPHRLRRAGGGGADPGGPAPGEDRAGPQDRAGGVQHLLRPARPAPHQPEFPHHGHVRRAGPAHPQPQCGVHDGGGAVLPPAHQRGRERPGVHRRLRKRPGVHLHHHHRDRRPLPCRRRKA